MSSSSCHLTGPYTEYKIVVVAITTRYDGNASTPIFQKTDVAAPSPPILSDLSCQKDGTIYVKWKRPVHFYNTIDFYIISFKASLWEYYRQFQINTSAEHIEIEVIFFINFLLMTLKSWLFLLNCSWRFQISPLMKFMRLNCKRLHWAFLIKINFKSVNQRHQDKWVWDIHSVMHNNNFPEFQINLHPKCEPQTSKRKGFTQNFDITVIATAVISCFGFMIIVLCFVFWRWVTRKVKQWRNERSREKWSTINALITKKILYKVDKLT